MTDPYITRQDLIDLTFNADRDAELIGKYLKLGFSPHAIAQTYSQIFFRRLKKVIDPETVASIHSSWQETEPMTLEQAVEKLCLEIANEFVGVVISAIKSNSPRS